MASASVSKSDSICNVVPRADINSAVEVIGGRPMVSSLRVAEHFGKRHHHVIRDIRKAASEVSEMFSQTNFGFSEYVDETGRKLPMCWLTHDGFTFVVMGYTGKDAMRFKEAYIHRFNEMEQALTEGLHGQPVMIAPATLTPEQKKALHDAVRGKVHGLPSNLWPKAYGEAWGRVRNKFNVAEYKDIPASRFDEALSYVKGMQLNIAVQDYGRRLEDRPLPLPGSDFDVETELAQLGHILYEADQSIYKQTLYVNMILGRIAQACAARLRIADAPLAERMRWESILEMCTGTSRQGVDLIEGGLASIDRAARALEGVARLREGRS